MGKRNSRSLALLLAGDREFCVGLVGHEEDHLAVVLAPGVLLRQMRLSLLNQVVFIGAADRFSTRAVQMCLRHMFTIA